MLPRTLVSGTARGQVLLLSEPLSFWGGVHPTKGTITDQHHPQYGASLQGRILMLEKGRGSSSSSSVLAELLRLNTGPAAILLKEPDVILMLGSLVARELYSRSCPVVQVNWDEVEALQGRWAEVEATGQAALIRECTAPETSSRGRKA